MARRSQRSGVLIAGHDGVDQQLVNVDSSGTLATGGPAADDAAASGNPVPIGARFETTPDAVDTGDIGYVAMSSRRALHVQLYDSSNNVIAQLASDNSDGVAVSGTANRLKVLSQGLIFNGTSWDREGKATSTSRLLSAANTTNATSVKGSAGNVFKIVGVNANAAARYLKLYNKATAPTVGTDTPVWTFYLPPNTVNGGQFDLDFGAQPLYFATGIGYALTTAAADADTGALTAADVIAMNIAYS